MSNVKLKLFIQNKRKDGTHPVVFEFIINRKRRILRTGYYALPKHWDREKEILKTNHPLVDQLEQSKLFERLIEYRKLLIELDHKYNDGDEIWLRIKNAQKGTTFYEFWHEMIEELKASGKVGNATTYQNVLKQFEKFAKDVPINQVTYSWLNDFKVYKKGRKVSDNGLSYYLRIARAVYNHALNRGLITGVEYPFKRGLIPANQVTRKRNVKEEVIKELEKLHLPLGSEKDKARDFFLLGFYLRGMDLIDLAQLHDGLLQNGRIEYNRQKSGSFLSVKVFPKAQKIIDKYRTKNKYWLPILKGFERTTMKQHELYKSRTRNINRGLSSISKDLKLDDKITTKVNRHSFATIAKTKGIPKGMIKEMLGHQDRTVTDIYLGSYDLDEVDKAHEKVIYW